MPKTIVEGPDGRKFAFPDTMPRSEVNAFMREKYGTKAREETMQDYLARVVRQDRATEARAKDIDRKATAVGRAEGERAAARMGVSNPLEMAVAGPAIGLAQQAAGREVFNREGTVLADEAAGMSAANAAAFFVPGMVNKQFGAQLEEGRRQQPAASFAGDLAGGVGPGEIIGAGVMKAAQAIGPGMAAVGRMFRSGPGPDTTNAIVGGTLGGIAPAETAEERARNVAIGAGLGAVARSGSKMAADLTAPGAPSAMPDAMPAGGYFGRQSMRPPGSGPSPREIELRQQWSTATPIVTQARTTAQSAAQAADAALQSKAPADIARAKAEKKALVGQIKEAQASRAGMDTPEDARLAETLASLTENTSDPVLLSTQISAAKTSLDRLLTDIGSPVEGNLIPVKTNILTRTQAPRSAAEGPQDRASVTRYAEGGDDVQPMGFGASTPKTSQQAARFETPGSPEYEAAVAKGLDMATPARMARAKEMGFDTDTVLYHGTPDSRGIMETGFKTSKEKFGIEDPDRVYFFAENKKVADTYADDRRAFDYQGATAETIPVYLKSRNPKVVDWGGRPFRGKGKDGSGFSIRDYIDQARADGHDSVIIRNVIDTYDGKGKPSTIRAVFDPSNIRSVNAAFDPDKATSSTLLAAAPFAAVGGAGLTSERELGSKMKRDKKD